MATILPFVIRRGVPASDRRAVGGSASIIIFPGVRYERPPAEERPRNAAGTSRKRKGKAR